MSEEEKIERLAIFIEGMEDWTFTSFEEDAKSILEFIASGFDLSAYEEVE